MNMSDLLKTHLFEAETVTPKLTTKRSGQINIHYYYILPSHSANRITNCMLTLCFGFCLCTGSVVVFSGTTGWRPGCFSPRLLHLACCGSSPTTCTCRPSGRSTQQTRRRSSVVTRPSYSCCLGLYSEIASWGSGWVHLSQWHTGRTWKT